MTTTDTDADQPTLRVRGPGDLVQAIPYLLGFHPSCSLVLVGLDNARVVVTARAGLADLAESPDLLRHTVVGLLRGGARKFVGVIFDDTAAPAGASAGELPWAGLAAEVDAAVAEFDGETDDVVLVSKGRLWSYICQVPACCPPEGRPLEMSSAVAAAMTYAGMVALPDRDSLAAALEPVAGSQRQALVPALEAEERRMVEVILRGEADREDRSVKRALFAAARSADAPGVAPSVRDDDLVRFAVALQRFSVRDPVWLAVDDGRLDARVLWGHLARRLPAPYDAPALFLFGWNTYRHGDGALARIAAERALESDPGYSAADLLVAALSQAIDPRRLPKLRSRWSA